MSDTIELKNFEFSAKTNVGLVRQTNEDYYGYFDTINGHVFVVCDGMGGHNAGEVAAKIAVASINHFFSTIFHKNIKLALKEAIEYANEQIIISASEKTEYFQMGTTIAIVVINYKKIYYAHLGDSRIYLFKNNKLQQLTKDHSYIQSLIDKGEISKEKARKHDRKNEIEKALGIGINVEPEICKRYLKLEDNQIILICSDGLNSMVNDNEIENIIKENYNKNYKIVDKLIDDANQKGGLDNITVQIIKFHEFGINQNIIENENSIFSENLKTKSKKLNSFLKNILLTILILISFIFGYNFYIKYLYKKTLTSEINNYNKKYYENNIYIKIEKENEIENILKKYNNSIEQSKQFKINYLRLRIQAKHKIKIYDEAILLEKKYNLSIKDIYKTNDLNKKNIPLGQEIIIPLNLK